MKATTEVTICGAEGLGDDLSSVGCYVSLDGRLHDVITPLNNTPGPDTAVLLPQDGELRLIVKNMGGDDHVFGSVSLPLSLLPCDPGQLWLPLFERLDGDLLHDLPENVDCPKILLIIGTVNLLSPVQELTEGSRSSIDDLEEFQQGMMSQRTSVEVGRVFDTPGRAKLSQLEHQLEKSNLRFRVSAEESQKELQALIFKHSQDQENWESLFQRQQLLTQDLTNQVAGLQKLYNQEQIRAETLTARLNALNEEYEASQERMIEREKTLMETVDEKVAEASNLQVEVAELQESLRNVTSDKFQLEELYKQLQVQLESGSLAEVQDSLTLAVEQLAESEIARKRLQDELNRSIQIPAKSTLENEEETDDLNEGLVNEIERLHDRMIELETQLAEKEEKEFLLVTDLKNQRSLEEALKRSSDDLVRAKETVAALTREIGSIKGEVSTLTSLLEDSQAKHAELQSAVSDLRLENDTLAYDLEESKKRPLKSGEVVDFLVGRYFSEKSLSVPLQKITDELYSIGSRRFSLVIKNAAVVAKVGNGTLLLDDFFRIYMPSDSRHFESQMSESILTPLSSHSRTTPSNRSMSVESKNHRRVNTMPETVSEIPQSKRPEQEEDVTSANTSEIRHGFDSENVPEAANHMEDSSYTPSPNKNLLHGVNQANSNKTPKTPGRRGTSAPKSGKSVDRAARKAPFR